MRVKSCSIAWFSLFALLSCLLVGIVAATAETISVHARDTVSSSVDLNVDDEVSGRIIVVGDASEGINFSVVSFSGQVVLPTQKAIITDFKFSASEKGTYRFIFDNSLSTTDKTISFNYDVKHYWFGIPQEVFLMIIVVIIGALALAIYAVASKG